MGDRAKRGALCVRPVLGVLLGCLIAACAPAGPEIQRLPSGVVIEYVQRAQNRDLPSPVVQSWVLAASDMAPSRETLESSAEITAIEWRMSGLQRGLDEALGQMRPGDEALVEIPAALAYGAEGYRPDEPDGIQPNANVHYRLRLIAFIDPNDQLVYSDETEMPVQRLLRYDRFTDENALHYVGLQYLREDVGHTSQRVTIEYEAARGSAVAMLFAGSFSEVGDHAWGEANPARAREWYRRAAEAGLPRGMFQYGYVIGEGIGGPTDPVAEASWYKRAAEAGNALGMNHYGWSLTNGVGVARDVAAGADFYRRSAELGYDDAMNSYGSALWNGEGVARDRAAATMWYGRAAEAGHAVAMNNYAWSLANGDGIARNSAAAVHWYARSVEAGNAYAASNIGMMYLDGDGVPRNRTTAAQWFRRGAEGGDPISMANYGAALRNGWGVPRDQRAGFEWNRRSAEAGEWTGMFNLGIAYYEGSGVPASDRLARQWFERARAAGGDRSRIDYALSQVNGGYSRYTHAEIRQQERMWQNQQFFSDMMANQRN